jgi:type 2 lantibiotic biosynthesis protein LanM
MRELFAALSLAERALPEAPDKHTSSASAQARLARWKSQRAFARLGQWDARVAEAKTTEAALLAALDDDVDSLAARVPPPSWLVAASRALSASGAHSDTTERAKRLDLRTRRSAARLAAPLVAGAVAEVKDAVDAASPRLRADADWLMTTLFEQLAERLELPLLRTTSLAVNEARIRGELAGDTPEARFDDFVDRAERDPAGLFARFPVLARTMAAVGRTWSSASRAFVRDFVEDAPAVLPRSAGRLVQLQAGAGDVHREGRTVTILGFEDGRKLVYKPHSLAVDVHWAALLADLAQRGQGQGVLPLLATHAVDLGDHGYVDFVPARPCATRDELSRYYRRQGHLLALMYALEGIDVHSENVIASGEHPVLVDLETLFHPHIPNKLDEDPAARAGIRSVLRVLLLPGRVESTPEAPGFDLSGLGDRVGQVLARPVPLMMAQGTDTMHVEWQPTELPPNPHRPMLGESEVDVMEYLDEVVDGFGAMARLLAKHRRELIAPGGAIAAFGDDEIRVLVRNTSFYAALLRASYHPPLSRDGLDRERIFDRLYQEVAYQPPLASLVARERADLWDGDIPVFTARASSTRLVDSRGGPIDGVLVQSGFEAACERLSRIDEADIERQTWLIRASFATIPLADAEPHWRGSALSTEVRRRLSSDERLAYAVRAGDRLVELAHRTEGRAGRANWLGMTMLGEREWTVVASDVNVYDGVLGVALFLGELARITGRRDYAETAEGALGCYQAQERLRRELGEQDTLGLAGVGASAAVVLPRLGRADEASAALDWTGLASLVAAEKAPLDLVGGVAGLLAGLLVLHGAKPSEATLALAKACGDRLVAAATPHGPPHAGALAWKPDFSASAPLAGFSHGASGMAVVLARLGAVLGPVDGKSYVETAQGALRYERTAFTGDNWWDYRSFDQDLPPRLNCMWCHGAAGVGFARAALLDANVFDDGELGAIRDELAIAAATTERSGFGMNHCLCHGDLGNVELLGIAADRLGQQSLAESYEARLGQIADSIDRIGYSSGVPLGIENPGLFTGLAGIGHGWLRAAAPDRVGSVLLIEPAVLT